MRPSASWLVAAVSLLLIVAFPLAWTIRSLIRTMASLGGLIVVVVSLYFPDAL